jgi:hypothetical protein
VHLAKRNLPAPGSGDWSDFYGPLLTGKRGITYSLDINSNSYGNDWTSIEITPFAGTPVNAVVEGLYGCISVILVSHKGEIGIILAYEPQISDQHVHSSNDGDPFLGKAQHQR